MKIKTLKTYSDKKVAILGYGKEGRSSHEFLKKIQFKNIEILDKNDNPHHYIDNLEKFDLIIKSPGISLYDEKIYPYKEKIISNTEIFFDNYEGKVIGITATKGKSTTSTLIYETLKNAGYKVKLVGNIGNPVLNEVDIINHKSYDYIVYELSSYMLETLKPHCFIAIFGNLFECHVAWHKNSFEVYKKAKSNILENAEHILAGSDLEAYQVIDSKKKNIEIFGKKGKYHFQKNALYINEKEILKIENIVLKGDHNKKNIASVLGVCDIITQTKHNSNWVFQKLINGLSKTLIDFQGLPHRIQNIGSYNDITFIDDAIATTPESTIAAIETFGEQIGTIFLGGQSTSRSFEELVITIKKYNIANIVLFPDSGNEIFGDFSLNLDFEKKTILDGYNNYKPTLYKTKSMQHAVAFAYQNTKPGKICILSNAAPSFSLWKSFTEKGKEFQKYVKEF